MLIMKFNKMIRNKFVWWIIAGIVIITFVGWFSPRGGCENEAPPAGSAGSLDGKPVTDNELRQARLNTYLGLCLSVGRVITITPRIDRELRDQAWQRIAALRAAADLKITATPEEILVMLQRDPQFQESGAFSRQRYQAFCQNVLGTLNATVTQFERHLAENIILQKLHMVTSSAVWISPDELQILAARYADSFRIDYVTLATNSIPAGTIKPTDADLRAFFAQNTNLFIVPPKVSVRYIALPVGHYLAKAVEKVDTNAIEEYYMAHSDEYMSLDTNGVRTALPIEQVTQVISNRILHEAAVQLARDAANDLSDNLVPDREGKALTFDAMAAKANQAIHSSPLFAREAPVPGIDAGLAFNTAAFRLRPAADECFSDAIAGSNHVYLMTLATNTEAFLPDFDAIKEEVRPHAVAKATLDAVEKKAGELHDFFQSGLSNRKTFTALAKEKAMNVNTTELFTASTAPDALSSPEILRDITTRPAGELSDVLPGANSLVIAYVVERKPAGEEELATIRQQVAINVMRRRGRTLFGEWQRSLVAGGRKLDHQPIEEKDDLPSNDEL